MFGRNNYGQIGINTITSNISTPTLLSELDGVVHASCGHNHTVFCLKDGSV